MKQNWSPALDFFLVQAIRPPSESSAVPITATSGLLGHELHTTLSRLSEALEEDSLSKIRTLQKTSVLLVYKFGLPWKTLSSPKVHGFHSTPKGPSCFFLVQVSEAPALNEVTLPRWLLWLHSHHSPVTSDHCPPHVVPTWATFRMALLQVQPVALHVIWGPMETTATTEIHPRSHRHMCHHDLRVPPLRQAVCMSQKLIKWLKLTVGVLTQSRLHRAARANLSHCKMGPSSIHV